MESFNIYNLGHQNKEKKTIEGSDSWLGGPEPEDEEIHDHDGSGESHVEHLPEGEALSGGLFDIPTPSKHLFEEEKILAEADVVSEHTENVAEMMIPVLRGLIAEGVTGGWDNDTNGPTRKFIEVEGADLEKAVKERSRGRKEECMVYELIKNEISTQNEQERIIRDALIKRASRYCSN